MHTIALTSMYMYRYYIIINNDTTHRNRLSSHKNHRVITVRTYIVTQNVSYGYHPSVCMVIIDYRRSHCHMVTWFCLHTVTFIATISTQNCSSHYFSCDFVVLSSSLNAYMLSNQTKFCFLHLHT